MLQNGALPQPKEDTEKAKQLKEVAGDLIQTQALFDNPPIALGLNYFDLLRSFGAHPELVDKLLDFEIQGLESEEPQPLSILIDGRDLTLLGSQNADVMAKLMERFPEKLVGEDLLEIVKLHPSLLDSVFENEKHRKKLTGRQLAEIGSTNPEIAQRIKEDKDLFERITVNPHVDDLIKIFDEQKEAGEITEKEYAHMCMPLLKEEKTYMNVGLLCKNNPELAKAFVKEGFLDKLNGEDLSFFAQYHKDITMQVLGKADYLAKLEGNDFKRLGVHHKKAALKILKSDELMKKAGPHAWCEMAAAHPEFLQSFLVKYDAAVRKHLSKVKKNLKTEKHDLLRFDAQFMITLADKLGPKFAEYLYEQAVTKKNPVSRYMLGFDNKEGLVDVDKVLAQLTRSLKAQGLKGPALKLQIGLTKARLEARNEQINNMQYVYTCALASISPNVANKLIDDMLKFPKFLSELNSGQIRTIGGNQVDIIMRILKEPKLRDKLNGSHIASMGAVDPSILAFIWEDEALKAKVTNNCNVPILAGRNLNVLEETAENKGYLEDIVKAIRESKSARPKEVPKGYVWYLYNILYPRAEVVKGVKEILKEALTADNELAKEEVKEAIKKQDSLDDLIKFFEDDLGEAHQPLLADDELDLSLSDDFWDESEDLSAQGDEPDDELSDDATIEGSVTDSENEEVDIVGNAPKGYSPLYALMNVAEQERRRLQQSPDNSNQDVNKASPRM